MKLSYPTTRDAVLDRFCSEKLIEKKGDGWNISNLAAILFAKRLDAFDSLSRKTVRIITYKSTGKINTLKESSWNKGYAVEFEDLIDFVHSAAPGNYFNEVLLREEVKMFPKQALRELIANALTHALCIA